MFNLSRDVLWSTYSSLWSHVLQWLHKCIQEQRRWKHINLYWVQKRPQLNRPLSSEFSSFKTDSDKAQRSYYSNNMAELKKSLNLLTEKIESLQSNLHNGALAIHEHCSKLRRDVQLNTEWKVEKIKDFNENLIKETNDYERICVSKYEGNIFKDPHSIGNFLKELRIFAEEKRKYLARYRINDEKIENSLIEAKEHLEKLNEETSRLEEIKFNRAKKRFRVNEQDFDADILGFSADHEVIILIFEFKNWFFEKKILLLLKIRYLNLKIIF